MIGSFATTPNIPTWYAALDKPPLNPPNSVFGPVWTILYICMGIALALVVTKHTDKSKKMPYIWFTCQLLLNTAWSLIFFGLRSPELGIIIILVLLASIALTMRSFYSVERYTAWLLAPYLVWVSFATYLTVGVAVLN